MSGYDIVDHYAFDPEPFLTMLRDQDYEDWLTELDDSQSRYFDDFASGSAFAVHGNGGRDAASTRPPMAPRGAGRTTSRTGTRPDGPAPPDGLGSNDSPRRSTSSTAERCARCVNKTPKGQPMNDPYRLAHGPHQTPADGRCAMESPCDEWSGYRNDKGYGYVRNVSKIVNNRSYVDA